MQSFTVKRYDGDARMAETSMAETSTPIFYTTNHISTKIKHSPPIPIKTSSNINKCRTIQWNIESMLKTSVEPSRFFEVLHELCPKHEVGVTVENFLNDIGVDVIQCESSFLEFSTVGTGSTIEISRLLSLEKLRDKLASRETPEIVCKLMEISRQEHFRLFREPGTVQKLIRTAPRSSVKVFSDKDINDNCTDGFSVELKVRDTKIFDLKNEVEALKHKLIESDKKFKSVRSDRNKYKTENIVLQNKFSRCSHIVEISHL